MNVLLNEDDLQKSEVVANAAMNRARNLNGANSYQKELGFKSIDFLRKRLQEQRKVAWLDLCCGTGKALLQAARIFQDEDLSTRVNLTGIDLVLMFDPIPSDLDFVRLQNASLSDWHTTERFDLITCVHGLHYIGDKFGAIQKAARWLRKGGLFVAHLDYDNLCSRGRSLTRVRIGKDLARAGFRYLSNRHCVTCNGMTGLKLPYRYLGADDKAGPNYTGQGAVNSYYERL